MTTFAIVNPHITDQRSDGDVLLSHDHMCMDSRVSVLPDIIIGIDTHKDSHVGAALTLTGQVLGTKSFPTITQGFDSLLAWAKTLGVITRFGIEGTGSYGKTLTLYLNKRGYKVIDINRGNRQTRRLLGKTDTIDAITAARTVLSGQATTIPKTSDGNVEMIRQLQIVRDNIVKNMTEITNIIKDMILSVPEDLRQALHGKTTLQQARICASLTTIEFRTPADSTKRNLARLSLRWLSLRGEAQEIEHEMLSVIKNTQPGLLDEYGIGFDTAATILIAIGDNIERIHSEAALAQLAGIAPIPASSGKTCRYRLNRGGNRKLNAAIHRIAITRMKNHTETRKYVTKRQTEGKSKREIIRLLKRYIIRHIYKTLHQPQQSTQPKN